MDKQRLEELFASYRDSLPERLAELDQDWLQLGKDWQHDVASHFERTLHSLAGSSQTFGCKEVGDTARELEALFRPCLENGAITASEQEQLAGLFEQLRMAIEAAVDRPPTGGLLDDIHPYI